MGASLTLDQIKGQQKRAHNKFLRDIYIELKRNSAWLVGKGHILNTDVWDSGISSGSVLVIDSEELEELSKIYHTIETNIYEAKICRQAAESHRILPASPEKDAAYTNHVQLSQLLHTREPDIKKLIDDFLKKDFWEKAGVNKANK